MATETNTIEKNTGGQGGTRVATNDSNDNKRRPANPNNRGGGRRGGPRREREKPEFANKIIDIRRVTRVMKGGRRFSFSVVMVAGDQKGRVGVGIGKASDTALAIEKAMNDAKKEMITVNLVDGKHIAHEVKVKYSSAVVMIQPAPGKGLVAGSATRTVLDLAGIKDVNAKVISRSKNKLNIARATIEALKKLTV